MRRLLTLSWIGVTLLGAGAWGAASEQFQAVRGPIDAVDVVEVHGVIDPAVVGYVRDEIAAAERARSVLILQIDSRGSYGDHAAVVGRAIRSARVPVVAWIGPSGARVEGGALFLAYSSSLVAMAPGAGIGPARPVDLGTAIDREPQSVVEQTGVELTGLASRVGADVDGVGRLMSEPPLPAGPALASGAVQVVVPDLTALIRELHGRSLGRADGAATVETVDAEGRVAVPVRFHDMGPVRRVLHAVSTPTAVYVLLVLGIWAIAFELTQPGLGIAGIFGILSLGMAGYGLSVIPVSWLGLGVLFAGMGLQGADVVIRRVGLLTLAGTVAFVAGSVLAWRGVAPAIDLAPWLVAMATVGGALFFGFGLTVALRSRERVRSTQTGLVGLVGETRKDLDPEGAVVVKGALWRARSDDGPIPRGRRVRVRGVDGLVLRVEEEPE